MSSLRALAPVRSIVSRSMAVLTLGAFAISLTGCFGSFQITAAVMDINQRSSENEFFQTLQAPTMFPRQRVEHERDQASGDALLAGCKIAR